jgi:outer membrane protein OmpA-like peptidoglycan-associated protein
MLSRCSPIHPLLQLQQTIGNRAVSRFLQAKLKVSQPGDVYEQEADRVADEVMRMPEPPISRVREWEQGRQGEGEAATLQRKCAACASGEGLCPQCAEEEERMQRKPLAAQITPLIQRQAMEEPDAKKAPAGSRSIEGEESVPPIVYEVLRSPGQPLEPSTRAFFEPRFGHDFSQVRVHTDAKAAESARAVNALAYTVGRDVVFGAGQYTPQKAAGKQLLAHELTHVVQQSQRRSVLQEQLEVSTPGDAAEQQADAASDAVMRLRAVPPLRSARFSIQRTCGKALGPASPDCTPSTSSVVGQQFLFHVNCDDLKEVETAPSKFETGESAVANFAKTVGAGDKINVHGFASGEGPIAFNEDLSCHRANKVADLLRGAGLTIAATFKHGGISKPPSADFWRSVVVEVVKPQPKPQNVCGPDVTDWLVDQVAEAKKNKVVLEIQTNLAGASRVAARYGFMAERVTEGAVAKKVLAEEARTHPTSTTAFPKPTGQIAASVPGQKEFGRAVVAALAPIPFVAAPEQIVLLSIRRASLAWKDLVGTGKKYDFKNNVLAGLTSTSCPANCGSSVTLCPSPAGSCFNADVPGNLFYAHVGRFVGFTELALQLGSQFAQLESTAHWDPPEDTSMISVGFGMKDPLDRAELCRAMASLRGNVSQRACAACQEAAPIKPV